MSVESSPAVARPVYPNNRKQPCHRPRFRGRDIAGVGDLDNAVGQWLSPTSGFITGCKNFAALIDERKRGERCIMAAQAAQDASLTAACHIEAGLASWKQATSQPLASSTHCDTLGLANKCFQCFWNVASSTQVSAV